MCIIVYKPQGITMPKNSILENCFDSNPDGAGFMYQDHNSNKVIINKGFMTFNSLIIAIQSLKSELDITAIDLILHFRYATQGSISPGNCHPFPITKKVKELKELQISSKMAMVHNGIINFCTDYHTNKTKRQAILSDTQIFIKNYLAKMNNSTLFNPAVLALIEESTGSKFVFMDANRTELIGNFIEDKGIYYSNSTYKDSRWAKSKIPKKYKQTQAVTDICAWCNQYGHITDDYNWLCADCEELVKNM